MSEYQVWLANNLGIRQALIADWVNLAVSRTVNLPGALTLALPDRYAMDSWQPDMRLEVWRRALGGDWQLVGDTLWLVRGVRRATRGGATTLTIAAVGALEILNRRIVAYASGSSQAEKTDYADDMIKDVVRENLGASATDTTRSIVNWLEVQADVSLAPVVAKAFSRRNVLTVAQEVCEMSASHSSTPVPLFVDVTAYPGVAPVGVGAGGIWWMLRFETFVHQRGSDHSQAGGAPVMFSLGAGNLVDAELERSWADEANYVYGAGQGEGSDRAVVSVSDATRMATSPLNRREVLYDGRMYSSTTALASAAAKRLQDARPRVVMRGTLLDTPVARFGVDWRWGDRVVAEYGGAQYDCLVRQVELNVTGGQGETVTARLESV